VPGSRIDTINVPTSRIDINSVRACRNVTFYVPASKVFNVATTRIVMDKDEMIVKEEEINSLNSDDSDLAAADADVSFASTDDKEVLIKIEPKDDYELPEIQQVDPTARELKEDANGNTHFMAYQDPTSATTHSGSGTFGGGLSRNVTHPSSSYQDPTSATTHSGSGTFGGGLERDPPFKQGQHLPETRAWQ
jgi:hypothetical protein